MTHFKEHSILVEADGRTLASAEVHPTDDARVVTPICTSSPAISRWEPAAASSTRC